MPGDIGFFNQMVYYVIYLGAILIPTLFWLWYFRYHDREHPEPWGAVEKTFALTFVIGVIAIGLERLLLPIIGLDIKVSGIVFVLLGFLLYGLFEESIKFVVLRLYSYRLKAFDEPIDGIIYGITVGLGFATCENIINIVQSGLTVAFSRFATATLLHALLCGIVGYFLSLKKFGFSNDRWIGLKALAVVGVLHAGYNYYSVFGKYSAFGMVIVNVALFVVLLIMVHRMRKLRAWFD